MAQLRHYARPVVVVIVGLISGWFLMAVTIDRVFARRQPAVALLWNPGSADANVRMADLLLQGKDIVAVLPQVADAAYRSLRRQPVNPGAARLLAITVAAHGDAGRGERLARYAEAMSRRDLATQLWLIEAAVQRSDIPTALAHYDRAMRTSVQGRTVLFPVLTSAAANPAIWVPLADILAKRPQWWRSFVEQFVPQSVSPDALYTFARKTRIDRPGSADPALLQAIEKRLVDLGAYRTASDLFNRAHGLAPNAPVLLRNGGFEQPGGWDPFEWNLQDDPDLSAIRQPSGRTSDGNALYLTAVNGRSGDVATQLLMLAPGSYGISATIGAVGGEALAIPQLIVQCANGGRELIAARFPVSPENGRPWHGRFAIPAGCPAQRIIIRVASALEPTDTVPWIDNIAIRREGS